MLSLEVAKQRVFDKCNLEGEDTDIYNHMFKYKAIRDLIDSQQEIIYNETATQLGF